MLRYLRLTRLYVQKAIKGMLTYRWSFLINCISQALDYAVTFLLMWIMIVKDVSFSVEAGELVGFIGENGAGKSTTLKMMSGILYPTSGDIQVSGICPYRQREKNAQNIGVVFGQRSRLNWDLPMADSFDLYREIYRIDSRIFRKNVALFVEMLHMQDFYDTPVRQLSLGQRMKAEVALALLHEPPILYLDEPTIGLDVMAKQQIREFIVERNRREATTTILTSHDMKDLAYICRRIIVLAKGSVLFDGSMDAFRQTYAKDDAMDMEDMVREIYEEEKA